MPGAGEHPMVLERPKSEHSQENDNNSMAAYSLQEMFADVDVISNG